MLEERVIPVDFGGGVDTKNDPKQVVAGKFLRVENGIYTAPGRVQKRNGYTALSTTIGGVGTMSAPQMTKSYRDELIAADQGLLLNYSPSQTAFESAGYYTSVELTRSSVDQATPGSGCADVAVLGNYALYGWSTSIQSSATFPLVYPKAYASVVDTQTGTTLVGPTLLSTFSALTARVNSIHCVLLGSSVLAVAYINAANTAIVMRLVSFAGSGVVSFGSELTISSNYTADAFDIVSTPTGASVFYRSNPGAAGVTIANINTAGAVTATVNIADATAGGPLHISYNATAGNLWAYWESGNSLYYAVYTTALAATLTRTLLTAVTVPTGASNVIAITTGATTQTAFYGRFAAAGTRHGSVAHVDWTRYATVTSAGVVGTVTTFAYGVAPVSRPFTMTSSAGTQQYAVFAYHGVLDIYFGNPLTIAPQPTFFVLQLTNIPSSGVPVVAGRFASGAATSVLFAQNVYNYVSNVPAISTYKVLFAAGILTQSFSSDYYQAAIQFGVGGLVGTFSYQFDFNSANAYRAISCGPLSILNGALLQMYDGNEATELGFHLSPELGSLTEGAAASGNIDPGSYSYIAIFQWTDAQGNLHQSAPSLPIAITTANADSSVTVQVTCAYLTQKSGVAVAIYRTAASGIVYYLVTDPVFLTYSTGATTQTISFVDKLSDADMAGNPQPYTYPASAVLENAPPPPSMITVAHNNRLWMVDSENPNNIWYTKTIQDAVGLSPSEFLTQQVDAKFGNISGLAEMDDKLVILKPSGMMIQSGDGANDSGSGSTLSFPQTVPSDVGCTSLKSIATLPVGVIFKSANGIYLLNRNLSVVYIGADVEGYNSQNITAATLVPGTSQVRFLTSTTNGYTLVYDYIFNKWATFTNHTGYSADIFQGLYTYATTGSRVFQESTGAYLDNATAFSLLAQTSWLGLGGIQGFQRVKRLIMLGDFINGNSASHNLSIAAAYDFSTTFQAAITYAFGAASASGVFQYRERLPIQKCDTISLLIQETTTGSSAEYIDLTNISFEAAVKRGANKLAGLKSVG